MNKKQKSKYIKTIGIVDNVHSRNFFINFSRFMKKNFKSKIHIYCNENANFFYEDRNSENLFESINSLPSWLDPLNSNQRTKKQDLSLNLLEEKYMPIVWFTLDHRQFGRGFASNAVNFPRKYNYKIPMNELRNNYQTQIVFWEKEFENKNIKMLISANLLEATVARKFGIITRTFLSARFESYYTWYTDEFWNNFLVEKNFKKLKNSSSKKYFDVKKMPSWHKKLLIDKMEMSKFSYLVKHIFIKIFYHFYWRVYKSKPRNYSLIDEIKYLFRCYRNINHIMSNKLNDLSYLKNKNFIYLPLQVEPERNLQGNSPDFFNQTELLLKITKYIPHDVYLVVKEHWISAPVRSDDFYKSLSLDFPNVIFIKANIPGIEIIKKSLGVATINGTSGLEAALMGKPVISFSKHNYYNFLDHVHVVKSDKDIHTFLKKILNKSFDNIKAKKDGAKLAKAIELSSVKLPDFSYSNSNIKENDLKLCFTRLLNTLR